MSATITQPTIGPATGVGPLHFGAEPAGAGEVQWLLRRNCSASPGQVALCYLALSAWTLAIGGFFWLEGATLVMPFAGLEVLALGTALLICARHAGDRERICLQGERLLVEHVCGQRIERVEFAPASVRVEPEHGECSLIELSGQGRRIVVGRFVRPERRPALADELRRALRRWQWRAGAAANRNIASLN